MLAFPAPARADDTVPNPIHLHYSVADRTPPLDAQTKPRQPSDRAVTVAVRGRAIHRRTHPPPEHRDRERGLSLFALLDPPVEPVSPQVARSGVLKGSRLHASVPGLLPAQLRRHERLCRPCASARPGPSRLATPVVVLCLGLSGHGSAHPGKPGRGQRSLARTADLDRADLDGTGPLGRRRVPVRGPLEPGGGHPLSATRDPWPQTPVAPGTVAGRDRGLRSPGARSLGNGRKPGRAPGRPSDTGS
jgi:hypothetical protein